jgi:glycerol-3-phosphate cytidylyltransferase
VTDHDRVRVGYAPGVYDLFHIGHLNILRTSKMHCDYLIAGVLTDDKAARIKGITPMVPEAERIEIVRHISFVNDAVFEDAPTKLEMQERLGFTLIFKGDDWKGTKKGDALEREFATVGVEVVYLPYTMHTSSTELRRAIRSLGDVAS